MYEINKKVQPCMTMSFKVITINSQTFLVRKKKVNKFNTCSPISLPPIPIILF